MKTVKLGDVCKVVSGSGFPRQYQGNRDGDFPFLKVSDMNLVGNEVYITSCNNSVDNEQLTKMKAKTYPAGTVIFPKIGAAIATNKKRILTRESAFDNNVMGLVPDENILTSRYLHLWLSGKNLSDWASDSELPSMRKSVVEDEDISIPSLEEQQRVVTRLDAAFERISAAEVLMRRNLDNVAALQKSILHKYLSASDSTHTHRLGDIFRIRSGDFLPRKKMVESGEYIVVGGNGESGRHDDFNRSGESVVIGRVGEKCGNVHYFNQDIWVTDNAFYISEFIIDVNKRFMAYTLDYLNLRQFAKQSAQPVISYTGIKEAQIYVPNLTTQNTIVSRLDNSLSDVRKLEAEYTKKLTKLTDLRQSLLQEAFSTTK